MNNERISPQQRRENPEPREADHPFPWFMLLLASALASFGIAYIVQADLDAAPEWGDGRVRAELSASARAPAAGAADGAALFGQRCAACHQPAGQGLPSVFPPLAGSEWVTGDERVLIALVLHGLQGRIRVMGADYEGSMPAFKAQLGDADLAALLSHLRTSWGNSAAPVTEAAVSRLREETAQRTAPYEGDGDFAGWR